MNKLSEAVAALHELDRGAAERRNRAEVHPLAVLLVTICYVTVCASFEKYDIGMLCGMAVYLLITAAWAGLSFGKGLRCLKYIFAVILLLGIVNPFFDRTVVARTQHFVITGGMLSMANLFIKGVLMAYALYFMIVQIGIEGVCIGLRALHVPGIFVTVVLLVYRYIIVLLRETERMWTAYRMRAPGQRGVAATAAGSFLGLLLLRSVDRGSRVYDSMLLRGYRAETGICAANGNWSMAKSVLYAAAWAAVFWLLRTVPVFFLIGSLLLHG